MKKFTAFFLSLVALLPVSCQKSTPLTVTPTSMTLYAEGTEQITATPAEGVTYTSSDEFYATVSETGLVTANKVGQTDIRVSSDNGMATIPVLVLPKYDLYPNLESLINAPVSRMEEVLGRDYTRDTSSSGETMYTYAYYNTYTTGILCSFENGVCTSIGVVVQTSHLTKFVNYLAERYSVAGMLNDYYFFLDHDRKVVVTMTLYNSSYMMAVYMPHDGTKSSGHDFEAAAGRFRSVELR